MGLEAIPFGTFPMIVDRSSFTSFPPVLGHLAFLGGCLHGERGRPWSQLETGGTTFRCVHKKKFRSLWCQNRNIIEDGGDKNKNAVWAFLVSLLASITTFQYHNKQLVVTPNEMVGLYCRAYPLNGLIPPFSIFSGLSLVLGFF